MRAGRSGLVSKGEGCPGGVEFEKVDPIGLMNDEEVYIRWYSA